MDTKILNEVEMSMTWQTLKELILYIEQLRSMKHDVAEKVRDVVAWWCEVLGGYVQQKRAT